MDKKSLQRIVKHKVFLIETLSADAEFILQHVQQENLITQREYMNLTDIPERQKRVINLLDKLIGKGEETCRKFIDLLRQDSILDVFPMLKDHAIFDAPVQVTSIQSDEYYIMTQRPLGYCLIINNYRFEENSSLCNREGTWKDKDDLFRLFHRMHFMVEVRDDLRASDIRDVIKKFAEKDHAQMGAFVCCVLTHGEKGSVLGIDGEPVEIRELTQPFAECRTLACKPKLFFIQACQGNEAQKGIWTADGQVNDTEGTYQGDAHNPALRTVPTVEYSVRRFVWMADRQERTTEERTFQEHAFSPALQCVPLKADFLIGMATVEYYLTFRHTREGSIYIQELCRQLEICRGNDDILSILTKVNREVSTRVLKGYKQMPEPRYTLTKKLVLPMD